MENFNFSLAWFKTKKQQEELQRLAIEEQIIANDLLRQRLEAEKQKEEEEDGWLDDDDDICDACDEEEDWEEEEETPVFVKPYKHLKMVNDVLTIVLNDGNILTKSNATQDDFKTAQNAASEAVLFNLVMSQDVRAEKEAREADIARARAMQQGLEKLSALKDFIVKDSSVYLKGINRSLPQLLVEEFLVIVDRYENNAFTRDLQNALDLDEEFQSLKRFFMWCCLNPRAEVAHELYRFLKENSFRITKQGFFVALRNVVSLCDDTELVDFVSNSYNKIKAIWKKNPDEFRVVKTDDGDYSLEKVTESPNGEIVGNLTSLYLDLPQMKSNRYTDDWTKTFDIRVGQPVNMPLSDCNWSTQDCAAAGLHFTSDQIHYVGCGDTSMLILINPMKVVGIGQHKGRCYEYLPIMTVPREEATQILHDGDFDTLQLDDEYAIRELQGLADRAQAGFVAESRKYDFNIPTVSIAELNNIVLSLDDMMTEIVGRIRKAD
jgi:hypothetical protein